MRTLKTRVEVIDALGGTAALAKELNRDYRVVHNWRDYSDYIPSTYYPYMITRLRKLNLTASPALWGVYENNKRRGHG